MPANCLRIGIEYWLTACAGYCAQANRLHGVRNADEPPTCHLKCGLTNIPAAWNAGQLSAYQYRILADRLRGVLCASQPIAWGAQCELSANVSSEMRQNINTEYVKCRPPTYVAYRSPTRRCGAKKPPALRHRAQTFLKRAVLNT